MQFLRDGALVGPDKAITRPPPPPRLPLPPVKSSFPWLHPLRCGVGEQVSATLCGAVGAPYHFIFFVVVVVVMPVFFLADPTNFLFPRGSSGFRARKKKKIKRKTGLRICLYTKSGAGLSFFYPLPWAVGGLLAGCWLNSQKHVTKTAAASFG